MPKGHHVDPKLVLWPRTRGQWIQGKMTTVGLFDQHASEMPLKGKQWELAEQEKNSEIYPFHTRKVTLTKQEKLNWDLLQCSPLRYVAFGLPTGINPVSFQYQLM